MRPLLPIAMLIACSPAGSLDEQGPLPPPPFSVDLELGQMFRGERVSATVSGVPAQADVYLLVSTEGPGLGPCHPREPICADILGPVRVLDQARANAAGRASLSGRVPIGFASPVAWVQAAAFATSGAATSPVAYRILDDTDGDLILDDRDNCIDTPNPDQTDDDLDGAGLACDCDDDEPLVQVPSPDDTVDGIDQDCDGYDGPALDGIYEVYVTAERLSALGGTDFCDGFVDVTVTATRPFATRVVSTALDCGVLSGSPWTVRLTGGDVAPFQQNAVRIFDTTFGSTDGTAQFIPAAPGDPASMSFAGLNGDASGLVFWQWSGNGERRP